MRGWWLGWSMRGAARRSELTCGKGGGRQRSARDLGCASEREGAEPMSAPRRRLWEKNKLSESMQVLWSASELARGGREWVLAFYLQSSSSKAPIFARKVSNILIYQLTLMGLWSKTLQPYGCINSCWSINEPGRDRWPISDTLQQVKPHRGLLSHCEVLDSHSSCFKHVGLKITSAPWFDWGKGN